MEAHRLALKPGYVLEHFRIERVLGKGGFGITYLAVDVRLGKKVAIKELLPDTIATRVEGATVAAHSVSLEEDWQWAKDRFMAEAQMLAGFSHPAIVGVHWLSELNGTVYMVMDYIEGESYEARLKRIGTEPDEASLMVVIGPVLEGLEEVHAKGLLHRDIKPENILIKSNGQPVLIDFGAARESVGKTVTMTSMVTHGYSPIEQYQSKGKMGPWTDIYAVGALMCRAITGEKPPVAADRVMDDEFDWLTYREIPDFSVEFRQTVDLALRIKPQERPQSVEKFLTEFRRLSSADTRNEHASHATPATNDEQQDDSVEHNADDSHIALLASSEAPPMLKSTSATKRLLKAFAALCLLALVVALAVFSADNGKQDDTAVQSSQLEQNLQRFSPQAGGAAHAQDETPTVALRVPKDYPTITAALAVAKEGQTVLVAPGIYEECLTMKSGVELRGENAETTIIRNRSAPSNVVTANGISSAALSNFTIEQLLEQFTREQLAEQGGDDYPGIVIQNSTITVQNCQVRSSAAGICIEGSGNSVVSNCLLSDCAWSGIFVFANTGQPELRGNNCFGNREGGILVADGGRVKAVGNTCSGNGDSGISVVSGQADVSDNTCSENKAWGIVVEVGAEGRVEGNVCNGNVFGGLAFRGSSTQLDIVRNVADKNGGSGIVVEKGLRPRSFENNTANGNREEPQINLNAEWDD